MQVKAFAAAAIAALMFTPSAGAQSGIGTSTPATQPYYQPYTQPTPGLPLVFPPATSAPGTPGNNLGNAITPQDLSGRPGFDTVAPDTPGINAGNAIGK